MDALEALRPHLMEGPTLAMGASMAQSGKLNDTCERYVWRCSGCLNQHGRHVLVRVPYNLVRVYQDKEWRVSGGGLNCLACRICFRKETEHMFFAARPPSKLEQRLYAVIENVFKHDTLSVEHKEPGSKKSIDVMLLERKIAFQADGRQHAKILQQDRGYDKWLKQRGISVVRLSCCDNGWSDVVKLAREKSDAGDVFCLYSPAYEAE